MATNTDTVAVLDSESNQVFPKAHMIRASVHETSRTMEHPLETGAIVTDHRIVLPIEINLAIFVESKNVKDVYNQIKQLFIDGKFLIVQTRSANYSNQFITALPHEETTTQSGTIVVGLRLKQAQVVRSQSTTPDVQPTDPANETTVDAGIKEPKTTPVLASITGLGS